MRIDVFSIFPDIVDGFCTHSLLGRARETGAIDVRTHNIRDFATDVHKTVDDNPFGGGAGMLMRPEPIFAAVEEVQPPRPLLLLGPGGQQFNQQMAQTLAASGGFSMLCGRYEGVDQRVREHLVDHEVSVGDVVLAGGEVAACLMIEAVTRLIPGVLGNPESLAEESHNEEGYLEYPNFTKPSIWRDIEVPAILLSGNHGEIAKWRAAQAQERAKKNL